MKNDPKIVMSVPKDMYRRLEAEAKRCNKPKNELMLLILTEYLEDIPDQDTLVSMAERGEL